jgi:hypothetical protein
MLLKAVLPLKLRRLIKQFAKDHNNLEEQYYAAGECWDISRKFAQLACSVGIRAGVAAAGSHRRYRKYCAGVGVTAHWVAIAEGIVIDFTARQYHHRFAFPYMWKDARFTKRLRPSYDFKDSAVLVPLRSEAWKADQIHERQNKKWQNGPKRSNRSSTKSKRPGEPKTSSSALAQPKPRKKGC